MKINNLALQFYTVREESQKDFFGTLAKVAEIGYKGIEFAGFFDIKAEDLKAKMDELGLVAVGSHTGLDLLKGDLDAVIEYNKVIGNKKIIIPWAKFENMDDLNDMVAYCKEISPKITAAGMVLAYHNHDHEFEEIDGRRQLDVLFEDTTVDELKAEVDTYWVAKAGLDPIEYLKSLGGERLVSVHLKDMADTEDKGYTEVGEGILDEAGIIETALSMGVDTFVVEEDEPKIHCIESARVSFENIKKMGYV